MGKKLVTYGKAVMVIAEKPILIAIGLTFISSALVKIEAQDLRMLCIGLGAIAMLFGTVPMFVAFAKDNWPKKGK